MYDGNQAAASLGPLSGTSQASQREPSLQHCITNVALLRNCFHCAVHTANSFAHIRIEICATVQGLASFGGGGNVSQLGRL
jgi:hypothetical protein